MLQDLLQKIVKAIGMWTEHKKHPDGTLPQWFPSKELLVDRKSDGS